MTLYHQYITAGSTNIWWSVSSEPQTPSDFSIACLAALISVFCYPCGCYQLTSNKSWHFISLSGNLNGHVCMERHLPVILPGFFGFHWLMYWRPYLEALTSSCFCHDRRRDISFLLFYLGRSSFPIASIFRKWGGPYASGWLVNLAFDT